MDRIEATLVLPDGRQAAVDIIEVEGEGRIRPKVSLGSAAPGEACLPGRFPGASVLCRGADDLKEVKRLLRRAPSLVLHLHRGGQRPRAGRPRGPKTKSLSVALSADLARFVDAHAERAGLPAGPALGDLIEKAMDTETELGPGRAFVAKVPVDADARLRALAEAQGVSLAKAVRGLLISYMLSEVSQGE